jgi:hypothetical protein
MIQPDAPTVRMRRMSPTTRREFYVVIVAMVIFALAMALSGAGFAPIIVVDLLLLIIGATIIESRDSWRAQQQKPAAPTAPIAPVTPPAA